ASKELRKVLELEPNSAEAYESMGKIAEQRNDLSLAKTFYEKAASIDEHLPGIFFKLGILSANYSQDAPKLTAKYFKRAVREEPDNVAAVYQLGILYYEKLDKPEKAAKYFLRTLELDAKHPFANYDLALLYHKMGDRLTAASYYHAAYQVNPELKTPNNDLAFAVHHPTPPPTASIVEDPAEEEVVDQERPVEVEKPRPVVKDAKGTVLITGATSGIGKATAELFAENGYRLILTGRRSDRLEAAQKEYAGRFGVETHLLSFDVRQPEAVQKAIDSLPEEWRQTDILINNAGLASGFDPIHEGDLADWDRMIDTNVKGLLYMTRAISPFMVERKKGHIINVCSTAGHEVYPNGNVYCATKHAVDALTKGMRLDLYKHGIRVSQVSPAHVEETEFALVRFHGDQERAKIYDDFQPLKSSDVAEVVYFMATRPAHVNIQDVLLMGKQQAGSSFIDRSGR
ncbi:MAG: SDR family NAD(P)-dependent oxidoreductase, partial [Bacteroidota bacterium]